MEDEQRELEQVELEVSQRTEALFEPLGSSDMDVAAEEVDFEKNMSFLVGVLQLPLETLQSMAANEEGMSILMKVGKCLDENNSLNVEKDKLLCKYVPVLTFSGVL